MKQSKFYITTPIYYVNDIPHIGHAYTTIAADVLARYYRIMLGADSVYFLTGTDEHGAKVAQAAAAKKMSPQKFTDEKAAAFEMAWDQLDISHNDFIRTTEKRHEKVASEFFTMLKKAKTPKGNDAIFEDTYEGLYCVGCESYKTEDDLVNGCCPDHGTKPEFLKEKNWFFRLSDYADVLKKLIDSNELLVQPESRKNEMLGLLKQGLKDIAISRQQVEWGIPLPFDKKQTAYVWIEALMNYISALGGPKGDVYKKFWPADVHIMAKDIIKFHALIWPAMLMALEIKLPQKVFAHGFFTVDGEKMSKTKGNVIDPAALVKTYGSDATRYLTLSQFGFGTDGDFNNERMHDLYNAALANEFGNLVSRTISMAEKYFAGKVPEYNVDFDKFFKADLDSDWKRYDVYMQNLQFDEALNVIWENIRKCNAYIDDQKPWELANPETGNKDVLADVMYNVLETIRHTAIMILPFMPQAAEKLLDQLGFDAQKQLQRPANELRAWDTLPQGQKLKKPDPLFPRITNE